MDEYIRQFDNCLQHEASFCQAACPFRLDIDAFISRLQEGRFNAAYKTFRDVAGFPFIVNRICSQSCRGACLRNAVSSEEPGKGEPIELARLEQACLEYATRTEPTRYNVPSKGKSAAIIGAGISGLACALRLATKKYKVTIYEKSDHIGGSILEAVDPDVVLKDIELQMKHLSYDVRLNTEVTSLEDVIKAGYEDTKEGKARSAVAAVMRSATTHSRANASQTYDAIYVATGKGGRDFGRPQMIGNTAVFIGGSIDRDDYTLAISDGLDMATAIDNFTLTKIHKYPQTQTTDVAIDETQYVNTCAVQPTGVREEEKIYTQEEAIQEAGRCMKCQCSACRLHCDLTEYVHKWPLRLRDEILATTAPGKSELHATPAVRLINSCTHCGLCKDTCPEDIDMDGLIQAARFRMHRLEKMPWAFNDFFLRDMAFTNSKGAYLSRGPEGYEGKCKYAFYPGCQLGASSPELVMKSYELLLDLEPSTGIMLGCCGIPADWAGDEDLHDEITERIRDDWERLGKPVLIMACPTCVNTFSRCLPQIETKFIYDVIAEQGIPEKTELKERGDFAVFDPCATDPEDKVRSSVRKICRDMKLHLEPLPIQEKWTACCSYGGHGALADPEFTKFVRDKRIGESELPYITYCINCRDAFLHEGKSATHILNLLFGVEPALETVTDRRQNRIDLKAQLLRKYWREELDREEAAKAAGFTEDGGNVKLVIDDKVRRKLSEEYILEQEAADVVGFCERTGRTLHDTESGTYTGYRKIGNLTYWVTYRPVEGDGADTEERVFELLNAYTHRMEIELEMIWNGEKIDIDM